MYFLTGVLQHCTKKYQQQMVKIWDKSVVTRLETKSLNPKEAKKKKRISFKTTNTRWISDFEYPKQEAETYVNMQLHETCA
jgi:hypothetical protein